ncbi:uncharacterized protein KZ484_008331 isoform 2-T3 [Pholidichthys leucotaenia]
MPRQCAHATCRNVQRKGNGHTFHVFPSGKGNEERRRKWCSLMKRLEGWEPKAWDVVCSQHFKSEDFDMTGQTRRLRDDAVPSQFDLPVHLQKKTRQTQAAKRALQPIQEQQEVIRGYMDHQPSESDGGNLDFDIQVSSIPDFHSYAASDNASLKAKLRRTEDRLAEVERQLKNAKAREKRCKTGLLSIKEELKEDNLMTTDLEERLEAYNVVPENVRQLLVIKQVPHDWSPGPDHQDLEPIHVKEEPDDIWTSPEEDGETNVDGFPFRVVTVKDEDDEERPESSQFYQTENYTQTCSTELIKTQPNLDPNHQTLEPNIDKWPSHSSETEVSNDDRDDDNKWRESLPNSGHEHEDGGRVWKEAWAPASGFSNEGFTQQEVRKRMGTGPVRDKTCGCEVCGKAFSCNTHLKRHMQVHTQEKPFSCDACGKRFGLPFTLKTHMRVHTGEKPFGCEDCGKTFSRSTHLKNHMRVHTEEKPFVCNVCGKRFKFQYSFKVHLRVHTGERPFGCDVCGKAFIEHESLKRHIRIHTGEKPFGCNMCGKRFGHQNALKRHLSVHTGEKPFACDVCGKKFNRKSRYEEHMRVHRGEKLFKCDECGKTFSSNTHLKRHMGIHMREKPFCCSVCSEKFKKSELLKEHESVHMMDNVELQGLLVTD